jgi:hypothetical protein
MIEQTIALIERLDQKPDKDKEDRLLLLRAKTFMQAFYAQQEALLKKSMRELDDDLDRIKESSTS